jgi:lipid-binding SYLF domain-containing protein
MIHAIVAVAKNSNAVTAVLFLNRTEAHDLIIQRRLVMKKHVVQIFGLLAVVLIIASTSLAETKQEKQAKIRKQSKDVLVKLYKVHPSARAAIKSAAGYATFSNFGMKILIAGGGKGHGMVFDNATKKVTYMKMLEVQAGLGFGAKKFHTIFVFETKEAMDQFVNKGWEFGGEATAAATTGNKGGAYQGAVSVMPGVWMYQLTDKGVALQLTGKGTKYYKDEDLN